MTPRQRQCQDARHAAAVRTYYEANDEALLGPVFDELRPRLMDFLRFKGVPDTGLIEDLVQEALAATLAQLRRHKFEFAGSVGSWAVGICWYCFTQHQRRWANKPTRPGSHEDPFLLLPACTTVPAELLPIRAEDEARAGAVLEAATHAVLGLDPNARAVVVLHYYHGYTVEDAAAQLGIDARLARERLRRGLDGLRQWGSTHRHLAPTADVYTALPRLDSGDLFHDRALRLAS